MMFPHYNKAKGGNFESNKRQMNKPPNNYGMMC